MKTWHARLATAAIGGMVFFGGLHPAAAADPSESATDPGLEAFREQVAAQWPEVDLTPPLPAPPAADGVRVAILARNQSTRRDFDDLIDPLRDTVAAEMAGHGMSVLDPADLTAAFHRFKITTEEERRGLIDGVFTGGSVLRLAQMIDADYLVLVAVNHADVRARRISDQEVRTYQARLSVRVLETAQGSAVFGRNIQERYPVHAESAGEDMAYFQDVLHRAAETTGRTLAASQAGWRRPAVAEGALVSFTVRTTLDELIDGLEAGVRAPNELLDEMRRLVGGVTVALNGVTIGSAPGTFQASPGLHQLRVTRPWMEPWQETVQIREGSSFHIALELSPEGLARFQSLEGFRAVTALSYAQAAYTKGITIRFDTTGWQNVALGVSGRHIPGQDEKSR